jgi:DNA-binding NarL/FixJ family response regulator
MPTTVVIADNHELLRDAVRDVVAQRLGFVVVGSVGDAHAAFVACQAQKPDLLVMDLDMPGRDAIATLADIKWASPCTRVVILTGRTHDALIEAALRQKVAAYLLKSDSTEQIISAFERVARGERVFSDGVKCRLTESPRRKPGQAIEVTRLSKLSPRENEVLRYIGRGMDNGEMARVMILSKRTVERHVSRLMDSLDIHDRAELQRFANAQNLTP